MLMHNLYIIQQQTSKIHSRNLKEQTHALTNYKPVLLKSQNSKFMKK